MADLPQRPTEADLLALDAADPLRPLRAQFDLPEGVIYLDGNSLGPLPRNTLPHLLQAVQQEWGQGLITSWNSAGWFDLPQRLGDRLAPWLGAGPGETVVCDSTSVNLFKLLHVALDLAPKGRRVLLSERDNFPTDLYLAQSLCAARGLELRLVDVDALEAALTDEVAVLLWTHVNYRSGRMLDMAAVNARAKAAGVLTLWDLAHSAGAVRLALNADGADFAVGCGYKYLNGGPGAPAFLWVAPRHLSAATPPQPLAGWWGHAQPFAFSTDYRPAPDIRRYLCGTQPVLALRAFEQGLATLEASAPWGGMAALRHKSVQLTELFIRLVEQRCAGLGLALATPRHAAQRGSQVALTHTDPMLVKSAYAVMAALIARGVIGDFRAGVDGQPDLLRFGFAPLYIGFAEVWRAVEQLRQVLASGEWNSPQFQQRQAVT